MEGKSKAQIRECLKHVKPLNEDEEDKIKMYLRKIRMNPKFCYSNKYAITISFDDFYNWYVNPTPHRKDIIVVTDTGGIGIVESICFRKIFFKLYMENNTLYTEHEIENYTSFRKYTDEELASFQLLLSKNNISWNSAKFELNKRLLLTDNMNVRITQVGVILGIGVVREINEKNEAIFYCLKMNDKPVMYSMEENLGNVDNYQFEKMSHDERLYLDEELNKIELNWNGYQKRIEPLNLRVNKGEKYYYICDDWRRIKRVSDLYRKKDNYRFFGGNYFITEEEALKQLTAQKNYRKKLLLTCSLNKI